MRLFWQIESRLPAQPVYPHLARRRIVKNGSANNLQQFKYRGCVKALNALTGTQIRNEWLMQLAVMHDSLSTKQVAGQLINIDQKKSATSRGYHRFIAGSKTVSALLLARVAAL